MANKRLEKALSKLTKNEEKLLQNHFCHNAILDTYFELQDEGKEVGNYNDCLRSSPKDFLRLSVMRGIR